MHEDDDVVLWKLNAILFYIAAKHQTVDSGPPIWQIRRMFCAGSLGKALIGERLTIADLSVGALVSSAERIGLSHRKIPRNHPLL